jgi:hypothetical protein
VCLNFSNVACHVGAVTSLVTIMQKKKKNKEIKQ